MLEGLLHNLSGWLDGLQGSDPTGTVGRVRAQQAELMDQARQFTAHLLRNGALRWQQNMLADHGCEMDGCESMAVDRCIACGAWVCLAHAHVSHRGSVLCDQCCLDQLTAKRVDQARPDDPPPGWTRDGKAMTERQARRILGVQATDSLEECRRAYKRIVAKHHPDKQRTDKQRTAGEARVRRATAAYEYLKAEAEKRAA